MVSILPKDYYRGALAAQELPYGNPEQQVPAIMLQAEFTLRKNV